MKIVKTFEKKNEYTSIISIIIDQIVRKTYHKIFVDKIEFYIGTKTGCELGRREAKIFIDYSNPFVSSGDERAIRSIILHEMFRMILRQRDFNCKHKFVEDVVVAKELIKNGYQDDLFYYNYMKLSGKEKFKDFVDFLDAHSGWLGFHGLRDNDAKFLKKLADSVNRPAHFDRKGAKILKRMKADLMVDANLKRVERHIDSKLKN